MTIHLVELQWYLKGIFVRLCLWYPKEHVNNWQQHLFVEETYGDISSSCISDRICKGTTLVSLRQPGRVRIIQCSYGSSKSAVPCSHILQFGSPSQILHSYIWQCSYYCPDICGHSDWHTDRLVQYIQLVMYGRIPYLNNSLSSWAIHRSNLRRLLYYTAV